MPDQAIADLTIAGMSPSPALDGASKRDAVLRDLREMAGIQRHE
ncbi:hypothetical protein ACPF7Z_04120 [Halomonas sp. GXIMD04776]